MAMQALLLGAHQLTTIDLVIRLSVRPSIPLAILPSIHPSLRPSLISSKATLPKVFKCAGVNAEK